MSTEPKGGAAPATRGPALIVLGVAAVMFVAGVGFILWHHELRVTAAAVMLILGWAAVLGTVYFLWRTADNADLDDQEDWWKPAGRVEELVREKKSLLKAIKETELDRDTGKLSKADADEMIARYRARAIDVIKAIEAVQGDAGDGDLRARIEREVRARVQVDRAGDKDRAGSKDRPRGAKAAKAPEPAAETAPAADTAAATVAEAAPATVAEAAPESVAAPEPESVAEAVTESEAEDAPQPKENAS